MKRRKWEVDDKRKVKKKERGTEEKKGWKGGKGKERESEKIKERGSKEFASLETGNLLKMRRENILYGNTWK